jgi:pimeloyl-ACP methyl ester carboxylesterase
VTVTWVGVDSATIAIGGAVMRFAVSPAGRIMGGVIPAQGVRIVRGAQIGPLVAEHPDYSAPANATYTAEDVTFVTPAGIRLAGTLTVPKNRKGRVPAVVTLTGSGQQDRDETLIGITGYKLFRQIADTLGRRGIAVLRIDDRGVGGSGGNPATETSADYADDIRATIAYLHSRAEIDSRRIALVGHSEGGLVAPMVAARDSSVRALVLMAGPSRSGRRILEYQYGRQVDRAPVSSAVRDSMRRRLPAELDSMTSVPWMRFFFEHDPSETARHVRAPVLILQGENDIQITPDQAPELAAAFRAGGNTHVTVRTFPQLNHLFLLDARGTTDYAALPSKQVPAQVLGAIADWLSAQFR